MTKKINGNATGGQDARKTQAMPGGGETVTSAHVLEAMSSPIRMRILGTLRVDGEQTVGSISARLGEATGAVSYHLRQLAEAGLVEKVDHSGDDRRKSWWRAVQKETHVEPSEMAGTPADERAVDMFSRSAAITYGMAYERYLDEAPGLSQDWRDAEASIDQVFRLTSSEMVQMVDELYATIRKWKLRSEGRGRDDAGTEQVALILQAFRWMP